MNFRSSFAIQRQQKKKLFHRFWNEIGKQDENWKTKNIRFLLDGVKLSARILIFHGSKRSHKDMNFHYFNENDQFVPIVLSLTFTHLNFKTCRRFSSMCCAFFHRSLFSQITLDFRLLPPIERENSTLPNVTSLFYYQMMSPNVVTWTIYIDLATKTEVSMRRFTNFHTEP